MDGQGSTVDNRGFSVVLVGHDRSRSCYDGNTGEFGGNGCGGGSCSRLQNNYLRNETRTPYCKKSNLSSQEYIPMQHGELQPVEWLWRR